MITDIFQRALRGEALTTPEGVFVRSMLTLLISALAVAITIIFSAIQQGRIDYRTMLLAGLVGGLSVVFHGIAAALKNSPDVVESTLAPVVEQEATAFDKQFADLEKGIDPALQNTGIQQAISAQMLAATGLQQDTTTSTNAVQGQTQVTGS